MIKFFRRFVFTFNILAVIFLLGSYLSVLISPAEAWMRREILPAAMTTPGWTANNTNLEPWCNGRALMQLGANFVPSTAGNDELCVAVF